MMIGVQSMNVVKKDDPAEGFRRLKKAGFDCCDFGLNEFLTNKELYKTAGKNIKTENIHSFYDKTEEELSAFFMPFKEGAEASGIKINQCHMPYPNFVPGADKAVNDYLREVVAVKSMYACHLLGCRYIVIHGFKLRQYLGSEEAEWERTRDFLNRLVPLAKEYDIVMCLENIYTSCGLYHIVEGPCCDAAKLRDRIDEMNACAGSEVLGACFDIGHANLVGIDIYDHVTTLGDRLKVLHLHDNDGVTDLHQIPFTFTRERNNNPITDWTGFIEGMKAIGFNRRDKTTYPEGVLSFETAPVLKSFPAELHDDVLHMIGKIGKYLSDRIEEA